jgi:hypothetical protein
MQSQLVRSDPINPPEHVQLALLLKTIPCLEQVDKSAGRRLLEGLNAETILVSFPAHSLGGRSKGMGGIMKTHFNELMAGQFWKVRTVRIPGELAFWCENNMAKTSLDADFVTELTAKLLDSRNIVR